MSFNLGQLVATRGVAYEMQESAEFESFVRKSFSRHASGDWGDLDEEDKAVNEDALKNGGRIFSAYEKDGVRLWIITEADRSVTTILFPDEY